MTWHEVTWDAYDTSSALVSAVEIGLLGYDVDTHRPLDRLGYALQNNPEFDSDGKLVIDNTLSYPFFEPREESGGTWGTWYNLASFL